MFARVGLDIEVVAEPDVWPLSLFPLRRQRSKNIGTSIFDFDFF